MRLKLTLILMALSPIIGLKSSAQVSDDFSVSMTEPYAVVDAGSKEYLRTDDGGIISAKMRGGAVTVQKIDLNSMKETGRNFYEDFPKKTAFQDMIKVGPKVFYIYRTWDKKAGQFTVWSREISTADASMKDPVELFKSGRDVAKSPGSPNMQRINNWNKSQVSPNNGPMKIPGMRFIVHKSFDESKIMIQYRLDPLEKSDKKNYDEMGFQVFDADMKKIWGSEVKMPATEAQINNVGYAVSSDGTAQMLVANRESKQYELYRIKDGNLTQHQLGISTEQLVRVMEMREDESGNFLCGGFYANGIEFKFGFGGTSFVFNANGVMYFEIDKEGKVGKKNNFDFEEAFIKQNLNERLKEKVEKREAEGKAGILDLVLTNVSVKKDGSIIFVGERQWVKNEFWGGPQQQMVFHFSNVIVVKVDPQGNLAWMRKLPKNQAGINGCGQMSISYMEGANADYVAYVDNKKNIDLDADGGIPEAHKDGLGGYLTTYKIDHATGKLEKHILADLKNIEGKKAYQFKAFRVARVSEKVFAMEIYIKGKQDAMVKFEMKK